eukprot:TRINITY_DN1300_c2_g1_i1.p1 TRINITY_DN1300_c2_g1~~TRINITY_DN1300_c2_g1_i1.p1  ORF type:complete len:2077 (+),score=563.88 TRINITY_DN1300_c2_g1_i1:135-6365(+)
MRRSVAKASRSKRGREPDPKLLAAVPARRLLALVPGALRSLFDYELSRTCTGCESLSGEVAILPGPTPFEGSVLFIDVSGFSKIASRLQRCSTEGAELLTRYLNEYFTKLLEVVRLRGGDVALFSGDAMLVQWGGARAAFSAVKCGWELLSSAGLYCFELPDAEARDGSVISCEMRLHLGASCGGLAHFIVGGGRESGEYRYLLSGRPVEEAGVGADVATDGQLAVTLPCWQAACQAGFEPSDAGVEHPGKAGAGPYIVLTPPPAAPPSPSDFPASRGSVSFAADSLVASVRTEALAGRASLPGPTSPFPDGLSRGLSRATATTRATAADPEMLKIPCARFLFDTALHSIASEVAGELRTVYTVFLKLCTISCTKLPDAALLHGRLDAAVRIIQKGVVRFDGMLNKVIMDDKGVLLLVFFGVPLHMHEDDAARAVSLGVRCEKRLRREVGRCAVGISRGKVFCGLTGSPWRCEYTAMGDGVNIAARLMGVSDDLSAASGKDQGAVTCDAETVAHAADQADALYFPIDDIILKGQTEPLRAFRALLPGDAPDDTSSRGSGGSGGGGKRIRARRRNEERGSVCSSQSTATSISGRLASLASASTASLMRSVGGGLNRLMFSPSMQMLPEGGDGASPGYSPRSSVSRCSISSRGSVGVGRLGAMGRVTTQGSVPAHVIAGLSPRPGSSPASPRPVSARSGSPNAGHHPAASPRSPMDLGDSRGAATRVRDAQRRLSGCLLDLDGSEAAAPAPAGGRNDSNRSMPESPLQKPSHYISPRTSQGQAGVVVLAREGSFSGAAIAAGRQTALVGRQQESLALQALVSGMKQQRRQVPRSTPFASPATQRLAERAGTFSSELASQNPMSGGFSATSGDIMSLGPGERRVAVVQGDVQMGKTAMLVRAQELAVLRGIPVLWLAGLEAGCEVPYHALRSVVRKVFSQVHIHLIEGEVAEDSREHLRFLAYLAQVADLDPLTDADKALPAGERIRRINAGAMAVFKQHCGWPFLLLVDDVQWLDDPSYTFAAAAAQEGARVVIAERVDGAGVAEPRASDPHIAQALARHDSALSRAPSSIASDAGLADDDLSAAGAHMRHALAREMMSNAVVLRLSPLSTEQQAALLRYAWDAEGIDPGLLRTVGQKAAGSPGFLCQMAVALWTAGLVEVGASGRAVPALGADLGEALVHAVPLVEAFVMSVVDRLSVSARKALGVAAVIAADAEVDRGLLRRFLAREGMADGGSAELEELIHQGLLTCAAAEGAYGVFPDSMAAISLPGCAPPVLQNTRSIISDADFAPDPLPAGGAQGGARLRFTRPLARDVVYNTILAAERRRLHGVAADLMEEDPTADTEQCTMHLRRYGDLHRAVAPATRAYGSCVTRGRVADAWGLLQLLRQVAGRPGQPQADAAGVTQAQRVRWALDSILCLYELGYLINARDECCELVSVIAEGEELACSPPPDSAPRRPSARRRTRRLSLAQSLHHRRQSRMSFTTQTVTRGCSTSSQLSGNAEGSNAAAEPPMAAVVEFTDLTPQPSLAPKRRRRRRRRRHWQPIVALFECCCGGAPSADADHSSCSTSSPRDRAKVAAMYAPTEPEDCVDESVAESVWQLELSAIAAELALWLGFAEDLEEAAEMTVDCGNELGASCSSVAQGAAVALRTPPDPDGELAEALRNTSPRRDSAMCSALLSPFDVLCVFASERVVSAVAAHPWTLSESRGPVTLSPLPRLRDAEERNGAGAQHSDVHNAAAPAKGRRHSLPPYNVQEGTRPVTVHFFLACCATLYLCSGRGDYAYRACARLAETDDARWAAHGHMLRAFLMFYYSGDVQEDQGRAGGGRVWLRHDEDDRVMQSAGSPSADGDACVQRFAACFRVAFRLHSITAGYPVDLALTAVRLCESAQVLLPMDCIPLAALVESLAAPRATDGVVSLVVSHLPKGEDDMSDGLLTPERRVVLAGRVLTVMEQLARAYPFCRPALLFCQGVVRCSARDSATAHSLWRQACEESQNRGMLCGMYGWRAAARVCLSESSGDDVYALRAMLQSSLPLTPTCPGLAATDTARADLRKLLVAQASLSNFAVPELQRLYAMS